MMFNTDLRVTAIILNYVNFDQTILCAEDLLAQDFPVDVVIVDNHSGNESFHVLREVFTGREQVSVIQTQKNLGYAGGNNYGAHWGIARKSVDYVLIINNDVRIPKRNAIRQLMSFVSTKQDLAGVGPAVVTPNGFFQGPYSKPHVVLRVLRNLLPVFPLGYRLVRRWFHGRRASRCYAVVGAFMLLNAKTFEQVGMFDEQTFVGAEEYILAERFRKHGMSFYYFPKVRVIHDHAQSATVRSDGEQQRLCKGLASMMYYFREYQKVNKLSLRLFEVSAAIYGRVFFPVRRRFSL